MSSSGEIELFRSDVRDCHDQVALLRAKLYRWGLGSNARLQKLERELSRAQDRLRDATPGGSKADLPAPPRRGISRMRASRLV